MTINNTFKQKTSAVVTSGFNSLKRITTKSKAPEKGPVRAKTTDSKLLPHFPHEVTFLWQGSDLVVAKLDLHVALVAG